MTFAEKLNRLLLNLGDKPTDNTLAGTPLTGEDTRLLKEVLKGLSDAIDALEGGGGSGVQSVTGTNVDITDPLNPIVNLTSSNIFDTSYGDVATAIANIDFDQGQLISDIADRLRINGAVASTGKQDFSAGLSATLTNYADNAAALAGGLAVGDFYKTSGTLKIVI